MTGRPTVAFRPLGLLVLLGLMAVTALAMPRAAEAAITLESLGTFNSPRDVRIAPGNPDRIYVAEAGGFIVARENGVSSTVLDISSLVHTTNHFEEGLLSFALAPDFDTSGKLYVFYSTPNATPNPAQRDNTLEVDEFTVIGGTASLASRRPLLSVDHPIYSSHNGGQIHFGPDGYLYIALGDGGVGEFGGAPGDPQGNSQNLTTLLGALLRIDPAPSGGNPYTVPADNPYFGTENDPQAGARDEIWSWGLRNPWRFSFDRDTGALSIGDVGQVTYEEVNYRDGSSTDGKPGRGDNFGWSCREGLHPHSPPNPLCPSTEGTWVDPIWEYPHAGPAPSGCAVTGGYVVRDESLGDLYGRYIYSDWCKREIRSLVPSQEGATDDRLELNYQPITALNKSPISFGEDHCGRLYLVVDQVNGQSPSGAVARIVDGEAAECEPAGGEEPTDPVVASHFFDPAEPDGEAGWYRTAPTLTVETTGGDGTETVEYRVGEAEWSTYSGPVDLAGHGDGFHSVQYRVVLDGDETLPPATVAYGLDRVAPASEAVAQQLSQGCVTSLVIGLYCPFEVTIGATDSVSGVAAIFADVTPAGEPAPETPGAYEAPLRIDEPGSWDVHYRSVDAAGNLEEPRVLNVTITPLREPLISRITPLRPKKLRGKLTAVARAACPAASSRPCTVTAPRRIALKAGGKLNRKAKRARGKGLRVVARPARVAPGGSITVGVRVTKSQCRALAGKRLRANLRVAATAEMRTQSKLTLRFRCVKPSRFR